MGACVNTAPMPDALGQILITEIMYKTAPDLSDNNAEWVELYNASGGPLLLEGCTLADMSSTMELTGLLVADGEYLVLARSAENNGGLVPDHILELPLNNDGNVLTLMCGDNDIDTVSYDAGFVFPAAERYSLSLDRDTYDANLNDNGANWCLASENDRYYDSNQGEASDHFGTPSARDTAVSIEQQASKS